MAPGSSSRYLRVLHVAQPIWTGVPVALSGYIKMLSAHGWENVVAAPAGGELTDVARSAGASVVRWEASRAPGGSTASEVWRLDRIVRRLRPDVVHLHSSKAGLAGRLTRRHGTVRLFTPHAWSWHAVEGPTRAAAMVWERVASRWVDGIMCGSLGEEAAGRRAGLRPPLWATISNTINPVDLPQTDQSTARRELGLGDGPLVVCVGRLAPQKGQDVLLDAWAQAGITGAKLVLVGDGEWKAHLERLLPDGVRIVPPVSRHEALIWTIAADVVVSASRYETLSLSVLEAAALGRPVVATAIEGTEEALSGSPGVVVPSEAPAPLAAAIIKVLDRGEPGRVAAEEAGVAIRKRLRRDFDDRGRALDQLYRELLERP